MALRRHLLERIARRLAHPIPLRLAFWDGETFEFSDRPAVSMMLTSPRAVRLMIGGDLDKLCDAYVSGEILVEGAVPDILACGIELAEAIGRVPILSRRLRLRTWLPRKHSKEQDAANIRFHYDVSNDFYRLWLDRNMVYSCAYFRNGSETLDVAQSQKLDHICRKLRLQPGDRFLDIGCGWGGLVCWAAKKYGVSALGATLSVNQRDHALKIVADEGVKGKAEVELLDYRDIEGEACFDEIASVGMYEHVGLANLQLYFDRMARLLRPGGRLLNHGIYLPNEGSRGRGPDTDFIGRYVFPGGELPTLAAVVRHVTQAGLEIADFEDLRPHYARTLSLWLSRLEARKHEAIAIAGPERCRIWRLFLGGMAFAFDAGRLSVGQIVAYKPVKDGAFRPWTREHVYSAPRPAVLASRLNWHEGEECDAAHA